MIRPRILRWLRISFSAVCLLVCVLLLVLWMRSYHSIELIGSRVTNNRNAGMTSLLGRVRLATWSYPAGWNSPADTPSWWIVSEALNDVTKHGSYDNSFGFGIITARGTNVEIIIPHWFLGVISAILAAIPWLPQSIRFSLRTLLIAVTLLSVLLGTLVYFSG